MGIISPRRRVSLRFLILDAVTERLVRDWSGEKHKMVGLSRVGLGRGDA